jgi:glutathione peroxidase
MIVKVAKMLAFALIGGLLSAVGGAWAQVGREPIDWAAVSIASIGGDKLDTSAFKGKVVLLVNTASFCGFTGQYKGLEALWRRYKDKGLVVLGVPSNDFGEQEPGSNAEIKKFCEANFDVTFPLADKQVVSGERAHPLYRWAARQTGALGVPTWNFHKILIGRDGRIVEWFTAAGGMGAKLDRAIEAALDVQS